MTSNTNKPYFKKPGKETAMSIMTLVSGIINIIFGITLSLGLLAGIVTILCLPIGILPIVLGIFEIIHASKLLSTNPRPPVNTNQVIYILEICAIIFGVITSFVVGIVNLVFSSDPEVKQYFTSINQN